MSRPLGALAIVLVGLAMLAAPAISDFGVSCFLDEPPSGIYLKPQASNRMYTYDNCTRLLIDRGENALQACYPDRESTSFSSAGVCFDVDSVTNGYRARWHAAIIGTSYTEVVRIAVDGTQLFRCDNAECQQTANLVVFFSDGVFGQTLCSVLEAGSHTANGNLTLNDTGLSQSWTSQDQTIFIC